jgi:F-type H+-transporting ATPase subunit delta
MAELTTVARPYAQAVFERASDASKRQAWSEMLQLASAVTLDENMSAVIANAKFTKEQVAELIIEVCGDKLNEEGKNLVRLLSENKRLTLLPEIAAVYEIYKAEAESSIEAEMVSAYPVNDAQQAKIAASLKQRLGRDVTLKCKTDESLIGGAVIRAGDMVIDGSVLGKLKKLASTMSQ